MRAHAFIISFLCIHIAGFAQDCDCDHIVPIDATVWRIDGDDMGIQPGDKVCFESGERGSLQVLNVHGSEGNPVIFKNMCDGKTTFISPASRGNNIVFRYCSFIHLTGGNNPDEEYGLEFIGAVMGVSFINLTTDIELDHVNIHDIGGIAIEAKTDPTCDPATWRDNFEMRNVYIHHNTMSNIGGEAFYVGNSHYNTELYKTCDGVSTRVYEHNMYNVEISYNIVKNIDLDGIQVSAVLEGLSVHHNYVYNYGIIAKFGHQNGIQMGAACHVLCYNNIVDTGTGWCIFDGSRGHSQYYNNMCLNPGSGVFKKSEPPYIDKPNIYANNIILNPLDKGYYLFSTEGHLIYNNIHISTQPDFKFVSRLHSGVPVTESNNIETSDINTIKFVNPSAKDYHLQPGSPAIDAGVDIRTLLGSSINFDLDDNARPDAPGIWDIGPYEYIPKGPTSDAGDDIIVKLPASTALLNGTGTSETGSVTYTWTKKSGGSVTLTNANTANLQLSGLLEGVYVFQLEVTDIYGSAFDEVTVTVVPEGVNINPTASAGEDQTLTLPTNNITLNGTGTDPDGTIVSYAWSQQSGPSTATMTNGDKPDVQLTDLVEGTYIFQLLVTDDDGATATATVTVLVNPQAANQLPSVNAGADKTIYLPTNQVTLTATASDPDGTIVTILWEKKSGPTATLANTNTLTLTGTNLVEGTYVFRITVTDDRDGTKTDEVNVQVLVANQAPVASAGADKSITLPTNQVTITGTGTDTDGSVTTYAWTKVSGGAATLTNQNTATLTASGLVAGVYVFGLTVTDDDGATGYDEMKVTVNTGSVNVAPAVSAGADKTITLPTNTLTLTGTASDSDGSITSILWSKKSGPTVTLNNETTLTLLLSNLLAGTYTFTLRATDNNGVTSSDDVLVTVLPNTVNLPPVANAGTNQFISLPTTTTSLTGLGSDPDGTIVSVGWAKVTGPTVTLGATNVNTLTISNLVAGQYVFEFTVTDNLGASASDRVTVSVGATNISPIVSAGADKTITLPTSVITLTATASDPDGTIQAYGWTQVSGPLTATLSGASTATLTASALTTAGIYVFKVTVADLNGATASDEVTVYVETVDNQVPMVSAGDDRSIFLPTNTATLTGTATDQDGTVTSYLWTQQSGPSTATLANETTADLTILGLVQGTYIFRLTVEDNESAAAFDEIKVTVFSATTNQPPVANGGGNKIIQLPTNSITLNGSGIDTDGSIVSYLWEKVSGPAVTIGSATSSSLSLSSLIEGVYVFRLTVTDNKSAQGTANVTVTVIPAIVNQNPLANAGQNQSLTLPTDNTTLVGSGYDPDGTISTYAWSKVSGPSSGTLSTPEAQLTTLVGLAEGVYTFRLTVTDDAGATGFDEVVITVSSATANKTPTANAGGNKSIFLPTTILNLFGAGFDPDGSIVSYAWKKVSGGTVVISNQTTPTLTLESLEEGEYVFQLDVIDNDGAMGSDVARVVVNNQVNQPPVVFAGGDKQIKLPQNSLTVTGSASDIDGVVTSYLWSKEQGGTSTIGPPNTSPAANVSTLIEGAYKFRLTVEDDASASAFDEMNLQVLPSTANLAPIVDAGKDASVYLPDNAYTSSATVSDDGAINTYLWTKLSGPAVSITNPAAINTSFSNLVEGTYVFRLTAIDDNGTSTSDDLAVTVFPEGVNKLPLVDAGTDQEITLPTNGITFNGTASDPDGTIDATKTIWEQVSGPAATVAASGLVLPLSGLTEGTYIFRLTVTDDQGAAASDDVKLIVWPIPPNMAPIVEAGINRVLVLPENSLSLTGTVTDPDGTVNTIQWTQQSGPSSARLENTTSLTLNASDLLKGTYIFRLSATDDEGATGYDDVIVFVHLRGDGLVPPIAYAGDDIVLVIPDNDVTVTGDGLDPDGFIEQYQWEQVGGNPADYTVEDNILKVSDLMAGSYIFRLTVFDTDTLSGYDDLTINVIEEKDQIPLFFSPNNDGPGDYWEFREIESYNQCSLAVFNRAGQEVFKARPYQNNWDGTYRGKPLSDGDYYYVISCDDGRVLKGAVRIIR